MKTHEAMLAKWKKDPAFKAEYVALEQEFAMFDELLKARQAAKLTQAEVARRNCVSANPLGGSTHILQEFLVGYPPVAFFQLKLHGCLGLIA